MACQLNIAVQRNEDYAQGWNITDDADLPIDLTGMGIALQVRDRLSNGTLIATAEIDVTDAEAGQFDVILRCLDENGAPTPLGAYGNPIQPAELPYDLRITDADGVHLVLATGLVLLSRGKTFA